MVCDVNWQDQDSSSGSSSSSVFPDGNLGRVMLHGGHVGGNNLKECKGKKVLNKDLKACINQICWVLLWGTLQFKEVKNDKYYKTAMKVTRIWNMTPFTGNTKNDQFDNRLLLSPLLRLLIVGCAHSVKVVRNGGRRELQSEKFNSQIYITLLDQST